MVSPLRYVGLAVVLAVAGCAIPARDNAHDPSLAPAVTFEVIDKGPENACGSQPSTLVAVSSRGRCLVLDATGTSDPQDTPLFKLGFDFFSTVDGVETLLETTTTGEYTLTREDKDVLPGTTLVLHVRATDPGGSIGTSDPRGLTLLNSAPVADAGPNRSLPIGGFAGAGGAPFQVLFSAVDSTDADGDTLTYEWSIPGAVPASSTQESVVVTIPSDLPKRYLATLRVSDGDLGSQPSVTTLYVGAPNIWLKKTEDGTPFRRLDSRRIGVPLPGGAPSGDSVRVTSLDDDRVVALYTRTDGEPVFTVLDRVTLEVLAGPIVAGESGVSEDVRDVAGDGDLFAWILLDNPEQLERWDLSGVPTRVLAVDTLTFTLEGDVDPIVVLDSSGAAWAVGIYASTAYHVTPAGVVTQVLADETRWTTGASARPGTPELWMVETRDVFNTGSGVAELVRFTGPDDPIRYPIGGLYATGLAFLDATHLWVSIPDIGLVLVDVDALDPVAPDILGAIDLIVPEAKDVLHLLAESGTGGVWASSFANVGYHVARDGTATALAVPLNNSLELADRDGELWFATPGDPLILGRGEAPPADGIVSDLDATSSNKAAPDPATGGLWFVRLFPPSLLLYSQDGELLDVVDQVETVNGTETVPIVGDVRIAPDGSSLWAYGIFIPGLLNIDLQTREMTTVLAGVAANGSRDGWLIPAIDGTHAWAWDSVLQRIDYFGIPPAQTTTSVAVLGGGESGVRAAIVPETGTLCVVTDDNALNTNERRLRVIHPAQLGTVDEFVIDLVDATVAVRAVGASFDPIEGDLCWIAAAVSSGVGTCPPDLGSTRLVMFRASDGAYVDELGDPTGVADDLLVSSNDSVWLSSQRCYGSSPVGTLIHYRRGVVGGFAATELSPSPSRPFLHVYEDVFQD